MTRTKSSPAKTKTSSSSSSTLVSSSKSTTENNKTTTIIAHEIEDNQIMKGDIIKMSIQPSMKGRNASGRSWKIRPQKRATSLVKTKVNNQTKTWEQRQQDKLARKEALELQNTLREERRQLKVQKKERRLENEKRRAENEYKNTTKFVQTLNVKKLPATLKAMSKKQLRQLKKTRLNTKTGVVEYVPAYSK